MKVILNKCYGGFRPSHEAYRFYCEKKGLGLYAYQLGPDLRYHRAKDLDSAFTTYFTKDMGDVVNGSREVVWDDHLCLDETYREDPALIAAVETLGPAASSYVSKLVVVEIPDGMEYVIDDYDGVETLHQRVEEW
ncbi:MAG: hypothetical protein IJG15_04995 [Lachnospiraceae bacterium]|nr:hypothetical protein [Lachnospiraceae bacterium]